MKICLKCKESLPDFSFHKDMTKRDFLKVFCKECYKKSRKISYKREKSVAQKKRDKDREEMNEKWWRKIARYHHLDGKEVAKIFISQDKMCYYCKVSLTYKNLHIEHYYPHEDKKIVIACKDCNRLKWQRNGDEFIEFLKEYISRF